MKYPLHPLKTYRDSFQMEFLNKVIPKRIINRDIQSQDFFSELYRQTNESLLDQYRFIARNRVFYGYLRGGRV